MSELLVHPVKVIVLIGGLIGLVGLAASLLGKGGHAAPAWVRRALLLSTLCVAGFLVLSFYVVVRRPFLSQQVYDAVVVVKDVIGSFGGGVLTTLFLSGEFKHWRRTRTQ
jgi:hypothetical protein